MLNTYLVFRIFIRHQLVEFRRSNLFSQNLWINILIGLTIIILAYGFTYFILLSDSILRNLAEVENTLELIHAEFLKLLLFYLHFRIQVQSVSALNIKHYKFLPISSSTIISYVILRSFFSFWGFAPMVAITPIYVKYLLFKDNWKITEFLIYEFGFFLVCINSNLIHALIKRSLGKGYLVFIMFLIFSIILLSNDKIEIWSVSFFINLIDKPLFVITILSVFIYLLYEITFYYFSKNIYTDLKN
jgi:hypothetical protein